MPPLYGIKAIMNYLEIKRAESFYSRVKLGMPVCKICGRIESSTELINDWREKLALGTYNKYSKKG
jgi:hypothetical protein